MQFTKTVLLALFSLATMAAAQRGLDARDAVDTDYQDHLRKRVRCFIVLVIVPCP